MVRAHPTQLTGRYFPVMATMKPEERANGAMMRALGRKSTADRIGEAPKADWKKTRIEE